MDNQNIELLSTDERRREAEVQYDLGCDCLDNGDQAGAFVHMSKALDLNPDLPDAAAAYGFCGKHHMQQKQYDLALECYNKAMCFDPGPASYVYKRAICLRELGRFAEAIIALDVVILKEHRLYEAHRLRAYCYKQLGKIEQAIVDCKAAIAIDPTAWSAFGLLSDLYQLADDLESALAAVNETIRLNSLCANAYAVRGEIQIKRGDTTQAMADISRALELDPKLAEAYSLRIELQIKAGQFEAALADLEILTGLQGPNAVTSYNKSLCLHGLGRMEESLLLVNQAVALGPQMPMPVPTQALALRARRRAEKHDYYGAILDLSEAIRLYQECANPAAFRSEFLSAYRQRAAIWARSHRWPAALADYTAAIDLDPQSAVSYFGRGMVFNKAGSYRKALADFNTAIDLDPQVGEYYVHRGLLYKGSKAYDKAIDDFTQTIDLITEWNLSRAIAMLSRGECYISQREWELAFDDLDQLIANFNADESDERMTLRMAYQSRAHCHGFYGRDDEAEQDRQTARHLRQIERAERSKRRQSPGGSSAQDN